LSAKIAIFLTILMFHIIVNAAEPNLGDARLFFSSEQRASMLSSKVKDSASTSIPTKSSTPIKTRPIVKLPDFVISGTLETSDSITLFLNGLPCEQLLLDDDLPKAIDCQHLAELTPPVKSILRIGKRKLRIKLSSGDFLMIDW